LEKFTCILAIVDRPEAAGVILDKTMALARRFGVRVELLIGDSLHRRALAILCSKLGYEEVTLQEVDFASEPLHQIILRHIDAIGADFVIKAPSGAHPMRRFTCDINDWRLANSCPVPILLVRDKAWAEPPRFAAAVDVADRDNAHVARAILQAAGFLALGCHAVLDVLYCEPEQRDEAVREIRAEQLSRLVREFQVGRERIQMFDGSPEQVLPPLMSEREYDVLVLGARTRHPGFKTHFQSMTSRMVDATHGDVLLVRPTMRISRKTEEPSPGERAANETAQLV
jgi:nucleotide-binding universal stress UspA family protein